MNKNEFENPSKSVRKVLIARDERDADIYNLDNIGKYWLNDTPKGFVVGINHEVLREILGIETWLKAFLNDPAIASMPLHYQDEGEPITVKDMCQIMLASTGTIKNILDVAKKYVELKCEDKPQ
jgi:hypothetical protein